MVRRNLAFEDFEQVTLASWKRSEDRNFILAPLGRDKIFNYKGYRLTADKSHLGYIALAMDRTPWGGVLEGQGTNSLAGVRWLPPRCACQAKEEER